MAGGFGSCQRSFILSMRARLLIWANKEAVLCRELKAKEEGNGSLEDERIVAGPQGVSALDFLV